MCLLISTALFLASCGAAATGDSAARSTPAPAAQPAGEAVALHAENTTPAPFAITAHGAFAEPWALAFEPGTGRLFITGKRGAAWLVDPASGVRIEVGGVPQVAYGGQGGFGDIAFAPDYAQSRAIYLSWAEADAGVPGGEGGNPPRRAVVGRGTLECAGDACTIEGLRVIWRQSQFTDRFGHFSHRLAFSPDGQYLFVSSGDRMLADPAQDLSSNLGKVLRLNLDGTPAPGNPFAAQGGVAAEVWSYGHRNLLGLQFDAAGQLWDIEHGPRGGDELNRVQPGANYGWPLRSYGINYNGDPIPQHDAADGFAKPAIFWNPVIAPGDFVFYRGAAFAGWQGDAIIAGLGVGTLVRVDIAADGSAAEVERWRFPRRLRDIAQDGDGALWLVEDGPDGRLLRLAPAR